MSTEIIKQMIEAKIENSVVEMNGDEGCSISVTVTSKSFDGKSPLARHRMVNDVFKTQFDSGELHALAIKTLVE